MQQCNYAHMHSIRITEEAHKKAKHAAVDEGVSAGEWVSRVIMEYGAGSVDRARSVQAGTAAPPKSHAIPKAPEPEERKPLFKKPGRFI